MGTRPRTLGLATLTAAALAAFPGGARAQGLLDAELALAPAPDPDLRVALAAAPPGSGPSLDFDLLGDAPKPAAPPEDRSLRIRRKMLNLHQGIGLGLLGLQVASTVTGQLNYDDRFGVSNTAKYRDTHKVVVYTNIATFAVVGGIALFAPRDRSAPRTGYGRTTLHKVFMGVATAGMLAQAALGLKTASREGYLDKQDYGRYHLAVGYATLAAMGIAVGALVF